MHKGRTQETWPMSSSPFITDQFNRGANQLLEKHNIAARLVNLQSTMLSDLTKKRRKTCSDDCQAKLCPAPEVCRKSHDVYLATCDLCGKRYVGITVRQLHARAFGHLRAANQRQEHTAFGDHYKTGHKEKDKPKPFFQIISQNHDDRQLHIEEAPAIKTLKPELNKRQEEMGTGFLPWTLSQLLLPFPNASFTPGTLLSLLLSPLFLLLLLLLFIGKPQQASLQGARDISW